MSKLSEITIIAGIVSALLMSLLLLSKKNKSLADKVLSIWIFITCINFLDMYLFFYENFAIKYPHTAGIFLPLSLVHHPFLYIYTRLMIKPYKRFPVLQLLNFVPFCVVHICLIPFYKMSASDKLQIIEGIFNNNYPILIIAFKYFSYVSGPVYIIAVILLIKNHRKNIRYTFSYTDKIDLNWIRLIIFGMCIIWIIIYIFESFNSHLERTIDTNLYSTLSGTIFIIFMGYYGMKQTTIFSNLTYDELQKSIAQYNTRKIDRYKRSSLKREDKKKYLDELKNLMNKDKLYLQPKLSLYQVAKKIDISTNQLSQLINEELNQNFFEFINKYRIEEVKRRLADPGNKNFTLITIAYDSGFNSKSSFNDVFKKYTGQTPKEYLKTNIA